jgi:hypothetical protein
MDKSAPSPPRRRDPTSPEHSHEDSPPIDSRGSSAGYASPTLTGEPGILNPLEVSASSNENDGEVGRSVARLHT